MSLPRSIIGMFREWVAGSRRKPLVVRGARQVGKTVAVRMFGEEFARFIEVNLDLADGRRLFERQLPVKDLYQALLLKHGVSGRPEVRERTLLFLDEIQECPEAVAYLRYFYEELPGLAVIAAGSLLEIALSDGRLSFPVGRIEQRFLRPFSFGEYLVAEGNEAVLAAYRTLPSPEYARDELNRRFHWYSLIGGMPEAVAAALAGEDLAGLGPIYESLLLAYQDDAGKYASNSTMARVLRHCIESAPLYAGQRIRFAGFGQSNYRSREVGEALRTLEAAMVAFLLYPTTSVTAPILPDKKKSPRLQFLDTGLLNHMAGIQTEYFHYDTLHPIYRGRLAEHVVAQELMARDPAIRTPPRFWVREKAQSSAEVDFVISLGTMVIPVEVKAGSSGMLRSLHQFIDRCPHGYAVRLYAGPLRLEESRTRSGKRFTLLNLPYYLAGRIEEYARWLIEE